MSTAKAQRLLLERLGSGATVLLSVHLALPSVPSWCDGVDAEGRAVFLVGRHQLGASDEAQAAVTAVLTALSRGHVPEGVQAVAYAPMASEAYAAVMGHPIADEVLIDGERNTGKTQLSGGILPGLAELHARAGFPLPLRALWLHSSLVNARAKTIPSLEQAHWGGLWTFRDDGQMAVCAVGGVEMVRAHFVGTTDSTASERLRMEAHVGIGDEIIPSLDESGGISDRDFDLAKNSARLPTRRRVMVAVTNPGDEDTWPYKRFILGGGRAGCVRCPVPASDRLTPAEVQRQIADFEGSPDLQARLGRGEWVGLKLGECVAEGYDASVHVAARRMEPSPDYALVCGWDGGHSPSCVIGQLIGGQVRIYASANLLGQGVQECAEDLVRPWLVQHAPWAVDDPRQLVHVLDPSMHTGAEASITISSEKIIRKVLGGRVVPKGSNAWPPRREAVLRLLRPALEGGKVPLAITPTEDTKLLRQALAIRWIYRQTPDGRVDRSGPKKPNSPWADVGDAFAYLAGWLLRGVATSTDPRPPYQATGATNTAHVLSSRDRRPVLPSDMQGARIIRSPNTWR